MSFSGQIYPEKTVGYFRIASDSGRHPIEPVSVGEFRIGSGTRCHLRFDSPEVPDVAAVLDVERDVVRVRTVEGCDAVCVNGTSFQECELLDGDLLEIGDHRLLFRLVASRSRITLDEESFASGEEVLNAEASLEHVVDRLGEQIELIERLNHTPEDGLADLIKAMTSVRPGSKAAVGASDQSSELIQVRRLIEKHHEASRIRLESLTQVLDNVVRQQKLIADTLEVLSERIQSISTDAGFTSNQRRASA